MQAENLKSISRLVYVASLLDKVFYLMIPSL